MTDCATTKMRSDTPANLALETAFDGGRLTSGGGLTWLARADEELGLCESLARHVPEWRRGKVRHSLVALVKQRVFQVACGYEDQDDSDALRADPLLKLACGRLPETGEDLPSQPTMSRPENAVGARACYRMAHALSDLYIEERQKRGAPPERILLDFDATDDPAHGEQEGSYYHGYYGQHMYHPLVVFDGETGQLVTAVLRPGNTHASRGTVAILKRIVSRLRAAWPSVRIEVRADAGFAVPVLYDYCEEEGIDYTVGLITNPRAWRRSPSPCSSGRGNGTRPKGRRSGSWPKAATGPAAGAASGGWCTRRRLWRRPRTGASWSPVGPRSPKSSTTGTWGAARPRTG